MAEQVPVDFLSSFAAPVGASDTTVTLTTFPVTGITSATWRLVTATEIMRVDGVAGNVLTVTRAAEPVNGMQAAVVHAFGEACVCGLTNAGLAALLAQTTAIGAPIGSGTPGSVLFVDASGNLGQDNANFFYDTINHRLGVQCGTTNIGVTTFQAGSGQTQNSTDCAFLDRRTFDNSSGSGSGHGFACNAFINRTNGAPFGFSHFDARGTCNVDLDHWNGYQWKPTTQGTSNITSMDGFSTAPVLGGSGVVSVLAHYSSGDCTGTETLSTQYGLFVGQMTYGLNNWAVWTDGATVSRFNGDLQCQANLKVNGTGSLVLDTGVTLGWGASGTPDVTLVRIQANNIALVNGTNGQTFNIYNTFTDSTHNEVVKFTWSGNVFSIQSAAGASGGTARGINILTGTTVSLGLGTNSTVRFSVDGATAAFLPSSDNARNIGSAAARIASVFVGTALNFSAGGNIITDTSTGTKIGTATNQKLGFFNAATVVQQANASAAGIALVSDANAKTALTAMYNALANLGLCASTA